MKSKIANDLDELLTANVINQEVKENIMQYYLHKKDAQPNRLFAIFGVLGSLLVGLGIILILAHNWDDFPRSVKTIWAFVPLVIGQMFVGYTLLKNRKPAWKETAATFLFFGIGASISLVSQVYNIKGEMSSFLLTWIVLAIPLIYLMKSYAVTLLHLLFATIYACNLGYFNSDIPWDYVLLILAVLPVYLGRLKTMPKANTTVILHWLFPLSVLISLGNFISGNDSLGFVLYILLFSIFYNIGKLSYFKNASLRGNGYLILGSVGTIITLLITSFSWVWDEFHFSNYTTQDYAITIVLVIIVVGLIANMFRASTLKEFNLFQFAGLIFTGIYISNATLVGLSPLLINLLIIALGIIAIVIGAKRNKYSILNYGLVIITALITCRFFDTNISFIVRGLLFMVIGAGFFGANYFMYRKQSQLQSQLKLKEDE
ncbi:DUF2157 domain-containing protein [Patiriisocius marinus]|uniref:DUF2157 domain-containing protein n=1 Tax=Patiriisocius marinus TaxID=1397112 RepID=A0A5J4ITN8_9FLAO|nr:DUF2157 domain-containing protein [Patiriisocius marinus]GER57984.1 hypothetical protein ULMA_00920 [Patiriisocius marinus]